MKVSDLQQHLGDLARLLESSGAKPVAADLVAIRDARPDVQVIGIAMEFQDDNQVKQFAEGMFVNYPIVLGDRKIAESVGKVEGLPTTFIYDPQGKLAERHVGKVTRKQLEKLIGAKKTG